MSEFTVDTKKEVKANFEVKVLKASVFAEGKVTFSMIVNGVTIYGMHLIEYKTQEGKEGKMITFPQWKGTKDGETTYNNYVFFPISKELKEDIIEQIRKVLK